MTLVFLPNATQTTTLIENKIVVNVMLSPNRKAEASIVKKG